jgi:hypothetical protein
VAAQKVGHLSACKIPDVPFFSGEQDANARMPAIVDSLRHQMLA